MPAEPSSTPVSSLLRWLAEHGARFPGAAARSIPGMGLGLVAERRLEVEEPILFVPRDVWLTRKTEHTVYRPVIDADPIRAVFTHSMSRLALLIALEQATPDSFFRTYLDQWGAPTVPYEVTREERAAIQGLPLAGWIDEQRALTENECADLRTALNAHCPEVAAAHPLDVPRWQWAYGHVMQRTFSVDIGEDEVWVLVPGMDLCNHADEPNAAYFAEEDGWHLEAARPIQAGEQIGIRYGRVKTSSDLLLYYGFVTPRNPNDRLRLELQLADDDPDRAAKEAAIGLLGLRTQTLVGPHGAIPSAFLHATILWGLDSATFRQEQPDVADPRLAVRALECVAAAIDEALHAFPSSIDEDEVELDRTDYDGWLRTFIAYRLNVKWLHQDAAAGVRKRIEDIESHGWRPDDVVAEDLDGRYGMATVTVSVR